MRNMGENFWVLVCEAVRFFSVELRTMFSGHFLFCALLYLTLQCEQIFELKTINSKQVKKIKVTNKKMSLELVLYQLKITC